MTDIYKRPLLPDEHQIFNDQVVPMLQARLPPGHVTRAAETVLDGIAQAKARFGTSFRGIYTAPGQIGIGPLTGKDFDLENTYAGFWQQLKTANGWNRIVDMKTVSKFAYLVVLGIAVLFAPVVVKGTGDPGGDARLNALVRAAGLSGGVPISNNQLALPRAVRFTVGGVDLQAMDLGSQVYNATGFQEVDPFIITPLARVSIETFIGGQTGFAEVKPWGFTVATDNYLRNTRFLA